MVNGCGNVAMRLTVRKIMYGLGDTPGNQSKGEIPDGGSMTVPSVLPVSAIAAGRTR